MDISPTVRTRRFATYETINNMLHVRVVAGICPLTPDKIHDFVLTLSRDTGVGYEHLNLEAKL